MNAIYRLLSFVTVSFISCGDVDYSGYYNQDNQQVTVCIKKDRDYMKQTIIHELGHHFYFKIINDEERKNWGKISAFSYADDYISRYAMTDEQEDFAETFMSIFYGIHYQDTGLIRLKQAYIQELINKYYSNKN